MSWAAKRDSKGLDKIRFLSATQLSKKLPIYQCLKNWELNEFFKRIKLQQV